MNLKDQSLVIKRIPAVIRILESTSFEIPVLSDEIVVTHAENEPLIVIPDQIIDRHDANTLPLLVQEAGVLSPSIVDAESIQLGVDVEVDE